MDRTLFAPTSRAHRHPQPHDQGHVWWDGEKRWLERTVERGGTVWHTARGAVPPVGAELNCHLDADRRALASRAHTALHLMLRALQASGAPPLCADPEVKGGGNARLELAGPVPPAMAAAALAQANAWVAANLPVAREFVPRGLEARTLDAQAFLPPDPYPGPPDTLTVARVGGVCAYPCDGTHVDRTAKVGRVTVAHLQARGGATALVVRVPMKP